MLARPCVLSLLLLSATPAVANGDAPWAKATCRASDMDFPVVDFHAHTFNFRHLPLRGIMYGWGVPDLVASVAADIIWEMTREVGTPNGDLSALGYETGSTSLAGSFRDRVHAASRNVNWFSLPPDAIAGMQQSRFEEELNQYLVDEIEYERSLNSALRAEEGTPITDYFMDLAAATPQAAGFTTGGAFFENREAMLNGMRRQDIVDKLVALLLKPFELVGQVEGAFRFFYVMIQPEDKLVKMLMDENCAVDYFVHHMMDLEPVYDDAPPVPFRQQHDIAKRVRDASDGRLVTFSAFVPFRYNDFSLDTLDYALASGAVGAKYYPPSGYNASVGAIPDKPRRFRGLIYQGGARKQWHHRYDPLNEQTTRDNWGVTIKNPGKAREEALTGVSARFLDFARQHELPIFAHHTPAGFEAYAGYGKVFAEPCSWLPVLEANPEMQLILGHSGGDAWYANDAGFDPSFARQAYNVCVSFQNVYCDFGYHEDVLKKDGQDALRRRLKVMDSEAKTLVANAPSLNGAACRNSRAPMKYSIFTKLMYGSDWMMVVKEANHQQLLRAFGKVFDGELKNHRPDFFGGNALRVLRSSGNSAALPAGLQ